LLIALLCAAGGALAQQVTVNPSVAKPEKISYLGPGGSGAIAFGALGGAAGAQGVEDNRAAFQAHVEKHGISIERIVREEVEEAVRKSEKLKLADAAAAGAGTLSVALRQYGLSIPHGFSSRLVPTMQMQIALADAEGKVTWTGSQMLLPLGNPVDAVEPQAVRDDPKVIEAVWRAAARHLATGILGGYQ
jgi:hypothetical protein